MEREKQLEFCKQCSHRKMNFKVGLLCGLTDKMADFEIACPDFVEDPIIKEQRLKDLIALREYQIAVARIEQENKKPHKVIFKIISIIFTIISIILAFME
ncbi:MAG: hypothetical protein IT222_08515 [Crocinitomix sp.]|nr:hypothetical protein [Crocinitomix sp.]